MSFAFRLLVFTALIMGHVQAVNKDGITYEKQILQQPCPSTIHVVTLDPSKVTLRLACAGEHKTAPLEKTSQLAENNNGVVAINGGYSKQDGTVSNVLRTGSTWHGEQRVPRAALGWKKDGSLFVIDIIDTKKILHLGDEAIVLDKINQKRNKDNAVLYTPAHGTAIQNDSRGLDIVIEEGRVTKLIFDKEQTKIPTRGFVFSIGITAEVPIHEVEIGKQATISTIAVPSTTPAEAWEQCDYILGGTPLLVHEGQRISDFSQEKTFKNFLTEKFARTAVGINKQGNILLVVVENTNTENANGMTMDELARLMEDLDCVEALNLSGGHSSTLIIEGDMKNNPHGGWSLWGLINWEKKVANALVVEISNS